MKELLILSGKGGTGKTTITSSFAWLAKNKVLADCDVDAADLHIILSPQESQRHDFISGVKAVVNPSKCTACGTCFELCRYDAIDISDTALVDDFSCEGCGVCAHFCPENAIDLVPNHCGYWFVSDTRFGTLVHAELKPGEENSGKLVSLVKQKARERAEDEGANLLLVDGPPGIGCPVISSFSGADLVIAITEPSKSGLHDLKRVIELSNHFKVPTCVIINKWDLNKSISEEIHEFCTKSKIRLLGTIPFDKRVINALVAEKTVFEEFKDCKAAQSIANIWHQIEKTLEEVKSEPEQRPR